MTEDRRPQTEDRYTALAAHYSRFRVSERLLLTGHSHQAWPDAGFKGQQQAWLDAADLVDRKWAAAEVQAAAVREGFARLLGDVPANVALGQNTHELVTRWLSALPLGQRPRIVTTDGEFHTIRRQLDRLAEERIEVVAVPARPGDRIAERIGAEVDDRTACVLVSSVLFETAEVVPGLERVAAACERYGASLLVDAYHHLNVVPFDIAAMGLERAFVTGGGYKYCQLGEGNCFLRVPPDSRMRPVLTGWFAEFAAVAGNAAEAAVAEAADDAAAGRPGDRHVVRYGAGAAAFGGATYDPTSHYRGAAVFAFHREHGLTAPVVHAINRRQVARLKTAFDRLDVNPDIAQVAAMPESRRGGFLALQAPRAQELAAGLMARGVVADARGTMLRLGPAPYLRDDQLDDAVARLGELLLAPP